MTKGKRMMVAIQSFNDLITRGRKYEIRGEKANFLSVVNNKGKQLMYSRSLFEEILVEKEVVKVEVKKVVKTKKKKVEEVIDKAEDKILNKIEEDIKKED